MIIIIVINLLQYPHTSILICCVSPSILPTSTTSTLLLFADIFFHRLLQFDVSFPFWLNSSMSLGMLNSMHCKLDLPCFPFSNLQMELIIETFISIFFFLKPKVEEMLFTVYTLNVNLFSLKFCSLLCCCQRICWKTGIHCIFGTYESRL